METFPGRGLLRQRRFRVRGVRREQQGLLRKLRPLDTGGASSATGCKCAPPGGFDREQSGLEGRGRQF